MSAQRLKQYYTNTCMHSLHALLACTPCMHSLHALLACTLCIYVDAWWYINANSCYLKISPWSAQHEFISIHASFHCMEYILYFVCLCIGIFLVELKAGSKRSKGVHIKNAYFTLRAVVISVYWKYVLPGMLWTVEMCLSWMMEWISTSGTVVKLAELRK